MKKLISKIWTKYVPSKESYKLRTIMSEILMDNSTEESILLFIAVKIQFEEELKERLENAKNQVISINLFL